MKVRPPATGQTSATRGASEKPAAELRAQGRKLLELAQQGPLVPASLLGLSQGSLDALASSLLEGASRVVQRRGPPEEE